MEKARAMFADPKSDFAFKRIFGSDEHRSVLLAFLNAMLELDEARRIVTVQLLSPEQRPMVEELKLSIVDVQCRDARGVTYVVEMQVLKVDGFEKRVVYNVAKSYVNQLTRAKPYPELNDVVGISICDFEVWPDEVGQRIPMLSRWHMTEEQSGVRGLGQIRHVFLELPKYDASRPPRTDIEKWALFFREAADLSVIPEPLLEQPFLDAFEATRIARFTVGDWDSYILDLIAVQNQRGALVVAERRGLHLGLARGESLGRARGEVIGEARGEAIGRAEGEAIGRAQGLRQAVELVCGSLSIDLTTSRRLELAHMDAAALSSFLVRLQAEKRWA